MTKMIVSVTKNIKKKLTNVSRITVEKIDQNQMNANNNVIKQHEV